MTVKTRASIAKKIEKDGLDSQYLFMDPNEVLQVQEESKKVS